MAIQDIDKKTQVDTSKPDINVTVVQAAKDKEEQKPPEGGWSSTNPPPIGHPDVGKFMFSLFEDSKNEKVRLNKPDVWMKNYEYFKGHHFAKTKKGKETTTVNLFFANVIRTVANIVNRNPVAEVQDMSSGVSKKAGNVDIAAVYTKMMEKWWKESQQHKKLRASDINAEVYGITIEKPFWNSLINSPDTAILDPFAYFPAAGYWPDISTDCPYVCHAVPQPVSGMNKKYGRTDITSDDYYYDLGMDRGEEAPAQLGSTISSTYEKDGRTFAVRPSHDDLVSGQALEIEVWLRDPNVEGGIRCVTITNSGTIVLKDQKNPNINWELKPEQYETNFLYKRLPFFISNSYDDTSSNWGFSALDQTYELSRSIEELLTMAIAYHKRSAYGVMLVGKRTGIKRTQLSNQPGLVLFPDSDVDQVKFISLPSLPTSYFNLIDLLIKLHDRVYAVQDADRGEAPGGVIAASAIVALQKQNAVLIQHKIDAIEKLVESRGRSAIALYQQHGHMKELVEVEGESYEFKGIDFAGMDFSYVVQAGSTQVQTRVQKQEQSVALYEKGAIDQQALLEDLNYPRTKAVLERTAEGAVQQALALLVQAGLPEEAAEELFQFLGQPQHQEDNPMGEQGAGGEQGNPTQNSGQKAGVPKAQQGQTPETKQEVA